MISWGPTAFTDYIAVNALTYDLEPLIPYGFAILSTTMGLLSGIVFWMFDERVKQNWTDLYQAGFNIELMKTTSRADSTSRASNRSTVSDIEISTRRISSTSNIKGDE